MSASHLLDRFAQDVAAVVPGVDAQVSHERYGDGIGGFEEPRQVEFIVEELRDSGYTIETEVPYPNQSQRCDIVLDPGVHRIPIEAKLLRFNRANGDIEPTAYDSIFSPLSGSLVADARKLADSGFDLPGGLLGLYYERGDEDAPVFNPDRLAEKVANDVEYWFDLTVDPNAIVELPELRHRVHRKGAVLTWEVHASPIETAER